MTEYDGKMNGLSSAYGTWKKEKKYTIFGKMPVICKFEFYVSHTHIVRYIAVQVRVMHRISSIDGTLVHLLKQNVRLTS